MPPDDENGMSRRTRLAVVAGFWGLLFGGSAVFLAVSEHQVSAGVDSVEAKASTVTVSSDDILAAMVGSDPDEATRVADKLGVDPTELEIVAAGEHGSSCLIVHVRRLGRERRISFSVGGDGRLEKVGSCKA
jgi:hypothetical protein